MVNVGIAGVERRLTRRFWDWFRRAPFLGLGCPLDIFSKLVRWADCFYDGGTGLAVYDPSR